MADTARPSANFPLSLSAFARLPNRMKLVAMVGVAVAVAVIVAVVLWARQPDFSVLFSNLSDRDGGEIVASLQQQNIPYQYSEGGGAILVPSAMVHDVRLRLASQGLPKGGMVGFEVMENQKMGASQFLEQINYQRALEGELARTISTISAVKGARVHLALPKQTAFLRDEQKPTASVLVNLQAGRTLEPAQIAGIVHLISSSVPDLNPANVSVVDQDGNLVSRQNEAMRDAGLDPSQLQYVREIEAGYMRRIEAIVAPIVGSGNIKAQVTAEVDFSNTEQVAETYKPNPAAEAAIRSQQSSETGSPLPPATGVPGALSNQPPVPPLAPITAPAAPGTPGAPINAAAASNQSTQNYARNSTINYEVDKTVSHTKVSPGAIRRLAIAVVVNQKQEAGKPKAVPLSDAEVSQITALVKEAVGFNTRRGDTLNLANAPFTASEKDALPQMPIWKDPFLLATLKDIGRYLAAIVVAWLVWTRLLTPLFRKLGEIKMPMHAGREDEDDEGGLGLTTAHGFDAKLGHAREVAKQDPKIVAGLIKEWVGGGESR